MLPELWPVIITAMLPVAELRGGIPLGMALGLNPWVVIAAAIIANCAVFFPVYFGLKYLYKDVFERFAWARRLVERLRKRGGPYIERYGIPGLIIFVAIPLPATGAWTGTLIAWLLGLDWKRSFLAVAAGVVIAGAIVSAVVLGGLGILGIAAA